VGGVVMGESELIKITAEEIVLDVPEAPPSGPKLRVTVATGGRESEPVFYEVEPWIDSLSPLRGVGGVPVSIPFDVPAGTSVKVQIADKTVDAAFDAARKIVTAVVPDSIETNGAQPVALLLEGDTVRRSNTRFFELLPVINTKTITSTTDPLLTTIAVTGSRLNGRDVSLRYGELLIRKGENASATDLSVGVARTLAPDLPVSVVVDGRESNAIPPTLESVEPTEARRGERVTLKGKSLSGKNITVVFGTTAVTLAPQPFSSRLSVAVPPSLAPGETTIKVRIGGGDSNALTFSVLA
jgi:hypothetical protein